MECLWVDPRLGVGGSDASELLLDREFAGSMHRELYASVAL
jgi:hypothetical protein